MYTVDMISKKYSAQGSTPSKTWIFATEKICLTLTSRGFDLNLCTVDSTKKKKKFLQISCVCNHWVSSRIKTEEKAKVVASV